MKTYVGLWDLLFGERVTLDFPLEDGGVKNIEATKKWKDKMEHEGKLSQTSTPTVKVNILDSRIGGIPTDKIKSMDDLMGAISAPSNMTQIEHWTIGEKISKEEYDEYLDPKSNELYAIRGEQDGRRFRRMMTRDLYEQTLKSLQNV